MARPPAFELVAGHLALDFVNTVDWRTDPSRRRDLIGGVDDLVAWAKRVDIVTAAEARALSSAAGQTPRAAGRGLERARRLRELLARVLSAAGDDERPAPRDLRLFNAFLSAALRRRRVETRATSYEWTWARTSRPGFDALLHPIVLAAADLLTSPQRGKIRICAAHGCGWLFLDTSRNARRRWCSMQSCGNRAKARRFYTRSVLSAG